ncbi:MAG: FG-GAP-like repeat-containing protein [Pseudomonadota bacterium]|nr:FG-GAP-like repeat-containing protein [Pseudomonadota bacterium]
MAGDLDGDGAADLVAGDWNRDELWIFRGPLTGGADTEAAWVDFTDAGIGAAITIEDLDGDGVDDLVTGRYQSSSGHGSVLVHYGLSGGRFDFSASADVSISGLSYAALGWAVATGGDLDGDGRNDLLVGAPGLDDGGSPDAGAVYVFHAIPTGTVFAADTYDRLLLGTVPYDELGASLDTRADLDGNGTPDLLAGAPGESGATPYGAGVAVYYDLDDDTPDFTVTQSYHGDELGSTVLSADLDGDGNPDLVAAAQGDPYDGGSGIEYRSGAVYAFFGRGF